MMNIYQPPRSPGGYWIRVSANQLPALKPNDDGAAANNTEKINAAIVKANAASVTMAGGATTVQLPPGFYAIAGTIRVLSNVTLLGAGIGKTVLYMPAALYTNQVVGLYDASSVAIDCSGLTAAPFTPNENVSLLDFTVESESTDGRVLYPILARNMQNFTVRGVEGFGVPAGTLITLDSVVGNSVVEQCYLHDCTTAVDSYTGTPQTTGVEVDSNRINSVSSVGIAIRNNTIQNLTFTAAALATYGYQTDGINTGSCSKFRIHDNYIENVGEGIDHFGTDSNIHDNELVDCYVFGVKLVHGASRNDVHDNVILRPGFAAVVIGGGNVGHSVDNYVHDNRIHDVGFNGVWVGSVAGLYVQDNGGTFNPNNNCFRNNELTGGAATMERVIRQDEGANNRFLDNEAEAYVTAYSVIVAGTATVINAKKAFVRASVGGAQTVTPGSQQLIEYNTEEFDTQSEFDPTTFIYTASCPRRLRVRAQIRCNTGTIGDAWNLRIYLNGTVRGRFTTIIAVADECCLAAEDSFPVVAGDTVRVTFEQSGISNRTITAASEFSYLTIAEEAC